MSVYCMVVAKNESSRYLKEFINHHDFFDGYFLYDDRSDDDTVEVAQSAGWTTAVRSKDEPSFMEHEGKFRFNSWKRFEELMSPTTDDWICSLDADEFLVSNSELSIRDQLDSCIVEADAINKHLIVLVRREIWKMTDECCLMRTDGYWKDDRLYRVFKYRPNGEWSAKSMGCGSAPTYVGRSGLLVNELNVLHFGYTKESDLLERYNRYNSLPFHGHNPQHIKSIVKKPILLPYDGPLPKWLEGKFAKEEE